MLTLKNSLFMLSVCLVVTGCSVFSIPGKRRPLPPDWDIASETRPLAVPTSASPTPTNCDLNPPPLQPVIPSDTNIYNETWVALNSWAATNNFEAVQRVQVPAWETSPKDFRWCNLMLDGVVSVVPLPIFSAKNSKGLLVLQPGTRRAHWNGTTFYFGFAPRLVQGEPLLHTLDLQKNLEPLFEAPAWSMKTNRLIVIDPAHGGSDLGALNVADNSREKQWTLDWALRLAPLLKEEGWQVVLTRTNDVDVSSSSRVALTEQSHADLFISLHFQESEIPEEGGVETWCLAPIAMPSNDDESGQDEQLRAFPNNTCDADNLRSALRVQRELVSAISLPDRGVRRTRFAPELCDQRCPAISVVGGYLSNTNEAGLISRSLYRDRLAEAIATVLK